jgi:hypothetical protein
LTQKAYSEVYTNYDRLSSINTSVKEKVHDTINLQPQNFHDIVVNKNTFKYTPELLQYILFPKKNID